MRGHADELLPASAGTAPAVTGLAGSRVRSRRPYPALDVGEGVLRQPHPYPADRPQEPADHHVRQLRGTHVIEQPKVMRETLPPYRVFISWNGEKSWWEVIPEE